MPMLSEALIALLALVVMLGAAVQVAIGAGLSVVSGPLLLLSVGPAEAVPALLLLNVLVSVLATAGGAVGVRWRDVALAAGSLLVGCIIAVALPKLPDVVLKILTAGILVVVALPRPAGSRAPGAAERTVGVVLAGLASGALTVWTATPGPILPVALARTGRSGEEIRRTMQPISLAGYGVASAWLGATSAFQLDPVWLFWLAGGAVVGTAVGFRLRRVVSPPRVVVLVRVIAAVSAVLLIASVLR